VEPPRLGAGGPRCLTNDADERRAGANTKRAYRCTKCQTRLTHQSCLQGPRLNINTLNLATLPPDHPITPMYCAHQRPKPCNPIASPQTDTSDTMAKCDCKGHLVRIPRRMDSKMHHHVTICLRQPFFPPCIIDISAWRGDDWNSKFRCILATMLEYRVLLQNSTHTCLLHVGTLGHLTNAFKSASYTRKYLGNGMTASATSTTADHETKTQQYRANHTQAHTMRRRSQAPIRFNSSLTLLQYSVV
jgi:hypothetical protein